MTINHQHFSKSPVKVLMISFKVWELLWLCKVKDFTGDAKERWKRVRDKPKPNLWRRIRNPSLEQKDDGIQKKQTTWKRGGLLKQHKDVLKAAKDSQTTQWSNNKQITSKITITSHKYIPSYDSWLDTRDGITASAPYRYVRWWTTSWSSMELCKVQSDRYTV